MLTAQSLQPFPARKPQAAKLEALITRLPPKLSIRSICNWSDWSALTKLTGLKDGILKTSIVWRIRNWSKKRFFTYFHRRYCNFSNFLETQKGDPYMSKKFSSPILMKFKICHPKSLRILHTGYRFHILNVIKIGD